MAALVKMIREDGLEADVHPDMVEDFTAGGYRVADAGRKAKAKPTPETPEE